MELEIKTVRVWVKKSPTLRPGEGEIIAISHNETALLAKEMHKYVGV